MLNITLQLVPFFVRYRCHKFTTRDKELHVYKGTRELYFLFKVMKNKVSVRFSVCLLVQTKFGTLALCNN